MSLKVSFDIHNFFGLWTAIWCLFGWSASLSWGKMRFDDYVRWVTGRDK